MKTKPTKVKGSVRIAGKKVEIGKDTVKSSPGSSRSVLFKSLKKLSGRSIFPQSQYVVNE